MSKHSNRLLVLIIFVLYACTSPSPKQLIAKRWKAVSVRGSEANQKNWEEKFEKTPYEFEFTKDGKFLGYEKGTLLTTASYTMADDGKSLVIENKMGGGYSMDIISLSSDKLEAVTKGFMAPKDTVIYVSAGNEFRGANNEDGAKHGSNDIKVIKAVPDNEAEAGYFTAKTAKAVYTVTAQGEISFKDDNGSTREFNAGSRKTGEAIIKLFLAENGSDLILFYESHNGEESFANVECINTSSSKRKWSKRMPALSLASPEFNKNKAYIATNSFIGKLNIENGEFEWSHADVSQKLKVGSGFEAIQYRKGKVYFKEIFSDVTIVVDDATGRIE